MNNDSNAVRGRHLESLANMFIGKITSVDSIVAGLLEELEPFTGATSIRGGTDGLVPAPAAGDEVKFLCGDGTWSTVASGSCILDTVCPSVNGGLWYEVANGTPVVKIYYNGTEYPLGGAEDTELSVYPSPLNVPAGESATATISCNSGGEITVTSLTEGVRVERSGNVITVYYAAGMDTANIKISAAATLGYTPAEILLPVRMAAADPNLTVTPSTVTVPIDGSITAEVSFNGSGTITVLKGSEDVTASYYDATNKIITVPYSADVTSATFTINLSACPGYLADSETLAVTMQPSRNLTISPATATIAPDGTATFTVSYDGGGTATLTWDDARIYPTYSTLPGTVTVPYYAYPTDNGDYPAATATFTVLYEGVEELIVCMPFTNNIFEDFCGGAYMSGDHALPVLSDGAVYFQNDKMRAVITHFIGGKIYLGGKDFTFRFWFKMLSNSNEGSVPAQLGLDASPGPLYATLSRKSNALQLVLVATDNTQTLTGISYSFGTWAHFEIDYIYSSSTCKAFLNGRLIGNLSIVWEQNTNSRKIIIGNYSGNTSIIFSGYVDEVQIYDGVALHTENFTPPARSST